MRKKWLFRLFTYVVVTIAVTNAVSAATLYTWYGGAGDWETAANWNPNHVPNNITNDDAVINSSGGAGLSVNVNSAIAVSVARLSLNSGLDTGTPCIANIKAGASLTTGSEFIIGYVNNSYAVANVYGTASLASLRIAGEQSNTKGVLDINGGNVEVKTFGTYLGCNFYGTDTGGQAQVNISNGGVFTVRGACFSDANIPLQFGSKGIINIMRDGTLKAKGNAQTLLQGYIAAGKINGFGLTVSYNSSDDYTYVQATASTTFQSTNPENVRVQGDLRNRMILALQYLDKADPVGIWDGFTTGFWGGDYSGRTLEAYSRTSLSLGYLSSTRFDEISDGLLSYQKPDGGFHTGDGDSSGGTGFWFGNARAMLGLVWAYKYTNDSKYLTAAQNLGDYYINHYFDSQWTPGSFHWVGTEAMVQLYKITGNVDHLNFAARIADTIPPVNPLGQHTHSYALSLRGIVQYYEEKGGQNYLNMVLQQYAFWKDHVMWPGGGIIEHLGDPSSYSANYWYDEGCSICDWIGLNMDLWRVTRDTKYMDMVERVALNHFLYDQDAKGGFCGDRSVDSVREGAAWPFCCAMHGTRTLSELTEYIATVDSNSDTVYVNLFYPSTTKLDGLDNDVNVVLETSYPNTGRVRVKFEMGLPTEFTLKYRLPGWSSFKYIALNNQPFSAAVADGYLTVQRTWSDGDVLDIEIDMPLRTEARTEFVGNDQTTDYSMVSLWKGPRQLVYNQSLNNHLWAVENPRLALRYAYQSYFTLRFNQSAKQTPLLIGSKTYTKGLGVHANSELVYPLGGQFKAFKADIGIDECVGDSSGSVRFRVCVDGTMVYGYGYDVIYGKDQPRAIDINVVGAQEIRLCVDDAVVGGDIGGGAAMNDYADWGDARLVKLDDSEVYLSDLPDDRALGIPSESGKVRLVEIDRDKGDGIVTLGYRRTAEELVPIKFSYLADLGYALLGNRPVLRSFLKMTCPQYFPEDLNDDCVVDLADLMPIALQWLNTNDITQQ